jgi:Uma2 family endonuclease
MPWHCSYLTQVGQLPFDGGAASRGHAMALQLPRRRFTVEDYYKMAEAGILTEDDRVELLDGEIVQMSPIGPRHANAVDRANRAFSRRVGDAAVVRVQNPIRLSSRSEPQPDLALLRPRAGGYGRAHPGPKDVLLVLEIADMLVAIDRRVKLPLYARAGVPQYQSLALARQPTALRARGRPVYRRCRNQTNRSTPTRAGVPVVAPAGRCRRPTALRARGRPGSVAAGTQPRRGGP